MKEKKEAHSRFLGTFFDRDGVVRMAHVISVLSWVVAGLYIFDLIFSVGVFGLQFARGFFAGMGLTDYIQTLIYMLERPMHGALYFSAMQAVSKGLLIFLDVEDNTRRAARR